MIDTDMLLNQIRELKETLESKTTSLSFTLDNGTNRNIRIIAEGDLDLSRKLDEALNIENERETMLLRLNHLENEVRKMKEKIG